MRADGAEWAAIVESEPELLEESPKPEANDKSIRSHEVFGKLFDSAEIPEYVEGFKCEDVEQMKTSWPEGLPKAREVRLPPSTHSFLCPLVPLSSANTSTGRALGYHTKRSATIPLLPHQSPAQAPRARLAPRARCDQGGRQKPRQRVHDRPQSG
jgi:hypothetical protein